MKVRLFIARLNSIRDRSEVVFEQMANKDVRYVLDLMESIDEQMLNDEIAEFKERVIDKAIKSK